MDGRGRRTGAERVTGRGRAVLGQLLQSFLGMSALKLSRYGELLLYGDRLKVER